jgi:hypothetical protein
MLRRMKCLCVVICAMLLMASSVMAQANGGGNGNGGNGGFNGGNGNGGGFGGGRGGRGGRGGDPVAQLQNTLANIQQALGASDQEWQVLQPKVQTVVADRQVVQAGQGRGGRGGGRRGGGGGNNATADNAVARALADLEATLQNENATADQISVKLSALRDAKTKAAANLAAAQKDLKDLLTARQEATLVTMGYME